MEHKLDPTSGRYQLRQTWREFRVVLRTVNRQAELERLMASLEPRLSRITVPALVIQSREDPVVNPKGTEKIFKLLGSTDKQMVMFNFQRHGILLGEGADRVYRTIGDFVEHIRQSRPPDRPMEVVDATQSEPPPQIAQDFPSPPSTKP